MHQELPDHCATWRRNKKKQSLGTSGPIASRDDGVIFLTPAKPNEGSVRRGFLLTLRVPPQNAGHDLVPTPDSEGGTDGKSVCAVHASLIPVPRATNTIRPREHGHTHTHKRDTPTPARARAPTHARTPEDDHDRFMLGFLERLNFSFFSKLFRLKMKELPKKHTTSGLHSTASASSPCFAACMTRRRRRCCLCENVSSQVMRSQK